MRSEGGFPLIYTLVILILYQEGETWMCSVVNISAWLDTYTMKLVIVSKWENFKGKQVWLRLSGLAALANSAERTAARVWPTLN